MRPVVAEGLHGRDAGVHISRVSPVAAEHLPKRYAKEHTVDAAVRISTVRQLPVPNPHRVPPPSVA